MSETLITGASGFVGSNLIKYLRYENIVGLSRSGNKSHKSFTSYETFWNNNLSFKNYIHLAGKAHDTGYKTTRKDFFDVNYELTKRIYESFLKDERAEKFIFVSSIAAVASKSDTPLNESYSADPNGFYGESKREAEKYIFDHLPNGKSKKIYILRPPMIHGPGNKGNLNILYSLIQKGIPWPLGRYNNSRSFISVENLCFIISELLVKDLESGIYHVADDESFSTLKLVEMISKINGKKVRVWNVPKPLILMAAKAGNFFPIPLNEERLEKLTENYLVSNEKIQKALNIERMPISSEEGMIKTLQSFESS